MIKTDLHTHSIASPDGSITASQYEEIINKRTLDCIAITDHNRIDYALSLQQALGSEKIIVGEEISTKQGDIIGLFLTKIVPKDLDIVDAISSIKQQGGLVYIPHPFETVRKGISEQTLYSIANDVNIIEGANGRAFFQNFGPQAYSWARKNNIPATAASDAHRCGGLGKTYTILQEYPTKDNICLLLATARKHYSRPSTLDILAPKLNRIKKVFVKK